ncbi:MAG: hypothetical protein NEHIOOID_01021 [Holosporales bacterium]
MNMIDFLAGKAHQLKIACLLFTLFSASEIFAFTDCSTFGLGKCQSAKGALECVKAKYPKIYNKLKEKSMSGSLYVLYDRKDSELIINQLSNIKTLLKGNEGADEMALRKIVLQDGYYAEIIEEPSCMKSLDGAIIMQTKGELGVSKFSLSEVAQVKNVQKSGG